MRVVLLGILGAVALAAPAWAQTCPGPSNPIRDYTTVDNRRGPGVDMYVFCGHQALIASEVAGYRDMHVDAGPAADVGDPDYARCRARRSWAKRTSIPTLTRRDVRVGARRLHATPWVRSGPRAAR